jgi:hypothetical protein
MMSQVDFGSHVIDMNHWYRKQNSRPTRNVGKRTLKDFVVSIGC